MFRKIVTGLILAAGVAVSAVAWAASPSVDQVYQAAKDGDYARAQSMMEQVLRDHPDSAKAHFVEAQLLAKQGKLAAARGELENAQRLEPGLSFAKPDAVQELKTQLSGGGGLAQQAAGKAGGRHGGLSWGPVIIIVAMVALVLMLLRSRRSRTFGQGPGGVLMPGGPSGPAAGPMGYGPGGATMMPPQAGGGMGSGIMGGLATGAAVGAGMIAGEALMHKVLGDGSTHQTPLVDNAPPLASNDATAYDMGGNDFGVNDAGSWDSGGGGDSWDGGGGSDDSWN